MKITLILTTAILAISTGIYAQTDKYSLEFKPFIRYDKQNYFFGWETVLGGKHYVSPRGTSYGLNVIVHKNINKGRFLNYGLGFYKQNISDIKRFNENGTSNNRLIKFPSPLFIPFFSDKYSYSNISATVGFEKHIKIGKTYSAKIAGDLSGLLTFSQRYHLIQNPEGSQNYRRKEVKFFGVTTGVNLGFLKSCRRIKIGPELIFPIFTSLKKDEVFPNENGADFRSKWLNSAGIGISFIYQFKNQSK